jgi:hypothetical protein
MRVISGSRVANAPLLDADTFETRSYTRGSVLGEPITSAMLLTQM